jgi:hypothetical protein
MTGKRTLRLREPYAGYARLEDSGSAAHEESVGEASARPAATVNGREHEFDDPLDVDGSPPA